MIDKIYEVELRRNVTEYKIILVQTNKEFGLKDDIATKICNMFHYKEIYSITKLTDEEIENNKFYYSSLEKVKI